MLLYPSCINAVTTYRLKEWIVTWQPCPPAGVANNCSHLCSCLGDMHESTSTLYVDALTYGKTYRLRSLRAILGCSVAM